MNLRKITEEEFDLKYFERVPFHADNSYEIVLDDAVIGLILLSDSNPHFGDVCTFIEWVEIYPQYQGKGLFWKVLSEVYSLYKIEELHFESCEKTLPIYLHMGAKEKGISELTENHMLVLFRKNFEERNSNKDVVTQIKEEILERMQDIAGYMDDDIFLGEYRAYKGILDFIQKIDTNK